MIGNFVKLLLSTEYDSNFDIVGDPDSLGGKLNLDDTSAGVLAIVILVLSVAVCGVWIFLKRRQYLKTVEYALEERSREEERLKKEEAQLEKEIKDLEAQKLLGVQNDQQVGLVSAGSNAFENVQNYSEGSKIFGEMAGGTEILNNSDSANLITANGVFENLPPQNAEQISQNTENLQAGNEAPQNDENLQAGSFENVEPINVATSMENQTPVVEVAPAENITTTETAMSVGNDGVVENVAPTQITIPEEGANLESVTPVDSIVPAEVTIPVGDVVQAETVTPVESVVPTQIATPVENAVQTETVTPVENAVPTENITPVENAVNTRVHPTGFPKKIQ